jgi:IS5 family transposase
MCADAVSGAAGALWDKALPIELRELPADLAAWTSCCPVQGCWRRSQGCGAWSSRRPVRQVIDQGRPTIAMETFVRLMVLKHRYRRGYRALLVVVSGSIHLRRFCRISLAERVIDESTVRKLTRRIGADTVNELTAVLGLVRRLGQPLRVPRRREDRHRRSQNRRDRGYSRFGDAHPRPSPNRESLLPRIRPAHLQRADFEERPLGDG